MLNPDSEARTDPLLLLTRPARAARGAERTRQFQRRRRFATVAAVALFLMAFGIARAWAWTASVQPTTDCNGTTFTGNVGNEPGSHTAAVTFGGETKSVTVPAQGGNSFTLHFASHDGGPWSYKGTWSETSEVESASGMLPAVTDCEQEETPTPTTRTPDTTTPDTDKDVFAGTATDQSHTPPDQHGTPTEKKAPPVTRPPLNQLPFTGPEHPFGMNDLQWAAFLIALGMVTVGGLMLVAGRRRYQRMLRSVEPRWGEARVRPDRDSADTNLLTTLFHRFHR